jgi:hypothetical protein
MTKIVKTAEFSHLALFANSNSSLEHLNLEFVSYFGIRASDLQNFE